MHFLLLSLIAWYIFYNGWTRFVPLFSYYDEFVVIISIGYLFINFSQSRIRLIKTHTVMIANIGVVFFIAILSLLSKIINETPFNNLVLFVFNISKIYIITFAAFYSKINLRRFINDLTILLKIIFYFSLIFILIDFFSYGINVFNVSPDWTGNILIGAHQLCSTSLALFLVSSLNMFTYRSKNYFITILYLFIALLAGQWSIIIFFIPLTLLFLNLLGYQKLFKIKGVFAITGFIYIFYEVAKYYYSGLIQNTAKFIVGIPQVNFWHKISLNGILDSSFLLFGVGPGYGGSPVAEKYATPFFNEYFKSVIELFSWTNSGIFTQAFSSLNTITSDVGLMVYFAITFSLIMNIFIIYKIVKKYKVDPYNSFMIPFCFLIMVGFSLVIIRSLLLNSYFAGGEPFAYLSCILFGLLYKFSKQNEIELY